MSDQVGKNVAAMSYLEIKAEIRSLKETQNCRQLSLEEQLLLANYSLVMSKRYFGICQNQTEEIAGDLAEKCSMYLEDAEKLYKEINCPFQYGECLLLKGCLEKNVHVLKEAFEIIYECGESKIGGLECIYKMVIYGSIEYKYQTDAMRLLETLLIALTKKSRSGAEFESICRFYGIENGKVDKNKKETKLGEHIVDKDGKVNVYKFRKQVHSELISKFTTIFTSVMREINKDIAESKQCPQFRRALTCHSDCKHIHKPMDEGKFRNHVNHMKRLILFQSSLLEMYKNDVDVSAVMHHMESLKEYDFDFSNEFIKVLLMDKIEYNTDIVTSLWANKEDESRQVFSQNADLCNRTESENYLKDIDRDPNSLLLIFYGLLLKGEFKEHNITVPSLNRLIAAIEKESKGTWPGSYKERGYNFHFFQLCIQSFIDHYVKLRPYDAIKTTHHFILFCTDNTSNMQIVYPKTELIMPLFELQMVRGILHHLHALPCKLAMIPRSYLRLMEVMDKLISGVNDHTLRSVKDFKFFSRNFYEHVRNQFTILSDIFFGVRQRHFHMLREGWRHEDELVLERVLVFSLVLLVNIDLTVDEGITFWHCPPDSRRQRMRLSLEELIMRNVSKFANEGKELKRPHLKRLVNSVLGSSGRRDIAINLKIFLKEDGNDDLLNCVYDPLKAGSPWTFEPKENFNSICYGFNGYNPYRESDAYMILDELHDAAEIQMNAPSERKPVLDIQKPVVMEEEFRDKYIGWHGCDVCTYKFHERNKRKLNEHARNPEHQTRKKLYEKYKSEVDPLIESAYTKYAKVSDAYEAFKQIDSDPDMERRILELHEKQEAIDNTKAILEEQKNWHKLTSIMSMTNDFERHCIDLLKDLEKAADENMEKEELND